MRPREAVLLALAAALLLAGASAAWWAVVWLSQALALLAALAAVGGS